MRKMIVVRRTSKNTDTLRDDSKWRIDVASGALALSSQGST